MFRRSIQIPPKTLPHPLPHPTRGPSLDFPPPLSCRVGAGAAGAAGALVYSPSAATVAANYGMMQQATVPGTPMQLQATAAPQGHQLLAGGEDLLLYNNNINPLRTIF